jgi:lambda family phage portal protein
VTRVVPVQLSVVDRALLRVFPRWGLRRIQARLAALELVRHLSSYEAASPSRRTSELFKSSADANGASAPSLERLRNISRDLRRNNAWARNGIATIATEAIGWGIRPSASEPALKIWDRWANSTACDYDGLTTAYGLQALALDTVVESGEVLLVKHFDANGHDDQELPLRIRVLEPDYLDTWRNLPTSDSGGPIIHGVEFDTRGRRTAYWLYDHHPGSYGTFSRTFASRRIPASDVIHAFLRERPGQVRGVPWLCSVIMRLHQLGTYDDALLRKAEISACFAAFVTETEPRILGKEDPRNKDLEEIGVGTIQYLKPGQSVTFGAPQADSGHDALSKRTLQAIAAGLGPTYEDLSRDYSQVNFSSARMGRMNFWRKVYGWQEFLIIPQICAGLWRWSMERAVVRGLLDEVPQVEWTAPSMPMVDPVLEGLAITRMMRSGTLTGQQAIREQGRDPRRQLNEIEKWNHELDSRGIVLDSDARKTNASGALQGGSGKSGQAAGQDSGGLAEEERDILRLWLSRNGHASV